MGLTASDLSLGFVPPPFLMGPDSELPEPPRWYNGTRMQWQYDRSCLALAQAHEAKAFADNVALHEATPRARYYVLCGQRYQEAGTVCGCWHCGGKSPQAQRLRAARLELRDAEDQARSRGRP